MYKILLSLVVLMIACNTASAQFTKIKKGDLDVSFGLGLIPTFAADRGTAAVLPLSARADYRLSKAFSLGAYAAYSSTESGNITQPNGAVERFKTDCTIVGVRAAGHGNPQDNWDVYGGFMVGYSMFNTQHTVLVPSVDSNREDINPSFHRPAKNQMLFSGFVGAAYYFKKNLGAFAELGYGISLINAGVQIKL